MNEQVSAPVSVPVSKAVSVHDVVAYILANSHQSPMSTIKLQRLAYYCQAWALVWDEEPLFVETIEAWANGPVVPALYAQHPGVYQATPPWPLGDASKLSEAQCDTVEAVLEYYSFHHTQWLGDLARAEAPWKDAREGMDPAERGNKVISHAAMTEYYEGIGEQVVRDNEAVEAVRRVQWTDEKLEALAELIRRS